MLWININVARPKTEKIVVPLHIGSEVPAGTNFFLYFSVKKFGRFKNVSQMWDCEFQGHTHMVLNWHC